MIHSLEGILRAAHATELLLQVGPVTLSLLVPLNAIGKVGHEGNPLKLFTSLVWKETGPQLFGFLEKEDVELFELLQTVSGVGPKLALSIMGHYERSILATALLEGDASALNRVPGIGSKTAQRLIVDLKDKASLWAGSSSSSPSNAPSSPYVEDALKALINLGYNSSQARKMIEVAKSRSEAKDLGTLITLALQSAGPNR